MRGCRRWSGVECDRVPPPRASPAARGKCGERVLSLPPFSSFYLLSVLFSCALSLSLFLSYRLSLSLSLPLFSFTRPLILSFDSPPPTPTPDAATSRSSVGRFARRLRGGSAGVAWTEINIRRVSTYSIPLPCSPRSRPLCPLSPSHPLSFSSSNPPGCPLPPSLTSSTPTFLILSTAPCSLEGGLAHIHMHMYAYIYINIRLYVYGEHQRAGKPSISVQGVFRYATGDP